MILTRAPLRISFVGGGTDLPDFYHLYPGRVISATIDKYVYIVLNSTPMINKISARYSISESVDCVSDLKHTRIRAALIDLDIGPGIEIGSYASLPGKTGLGSSSSFSVALIKALYSYIGKNITRQELAEEACRLEIELVKEPIGKQDQYAAAIGGFNVFQFNPDNSVKIKPVLIDHTAQSILEQHLLVFFTGITRLASSVLKEQKLNINKKIKGLREIADLVAPFEESLLKKDMKKAGELLNKNWTIKRTLASRITSPVIDKLYKASLRNGAWGGKILGAGGGGCLMLIVPPTKRNKVLTSLKRVAEKNNLDKAKEVPIRFVQSGVDTLYSI